MLMNNLDPEVAERPDDLVVYGGTGKAARNWECFDAHRRDAARAGRRRDAAGPVAASRSASSAPTRDAPRVLIANSHAGARTGPPGRSSASSSGMGLTMYGQMTAGSWIYIGTQGILQGTYETFAEAGAPALRRQPRAAGWSSPAGLGGMGGAQPLAATMNEGVVLGVEVDPHRASSGGSRTRYLRPSATDSLDEAAGPAPGGREPRAGRSPSAWSATPPTSCPSWSRRGVAPDLAHRPDLGATTRSTATSRTA